MAVGGTPNSVARGAHVDLPLMLAIIGGEPARFAPFVRPLSPDGRPRRARFRRAAPSISVHGFVAETSQEAADTFYPAQAEVMNRIGRERGWRPTNRAQFEAGAGPAARSSSAAPRR